MPLYQNSIIYKLVHCNDLNNENIYIGSTTNFRCRKNSHKTNSCDEKSKNYNLQVYDFIRNNDGWDNWLMLPVEVYPCESKKDLETRERYWIEHFKSSLNKNIPTRTYKEYLEYQKEYYEDNKEKIQKYKKEYHENNKEKIQEKVKKWRVDNKERFDERLRQTVICDCGCKVRKDVLKRHQTTKKHKDFMKQKEIC